MSRIIAMAAALGASLALAEVPDNPKIAYFDPTGLLQTKAAAVHIDKMRNERGFKDDREQLIAKQTEGRKIRDRAQKDFETMSNDEKQQVQNRLTDLAADIQHLQRKLAAREQAVVETIELELASKLRNVIEDIVDEQKITVLLRPGSASYVSPEINITEDVVKRLDETGGRKK
ncbi:MAG: OmpH family outer membrane protein [Gammaproteobacteria bacterium AqS3]|nr:OmpH family outer membrane protein [Gammaproteobacteria bacterium AqS3]